MNAALAELDQLQPPSEDGAISRALTDLDAKIDAWTTAVAQTQDRIASDVDGITELLEETAAAEARLASAAAEAVAHESPESASADVDAALQDQEPSVAEFEAENEAEEYVAAEEAEPVAETEEYDAIVSEELLEQEDETDEPVAEAEAEEEDVPLIDESTLPTQTVELDESGVSDESAGEETGDVIEAMLAEFPPDVAERLKIMHATDETRRSMAEIISAYKAEMQDADELLADMDPEAAQAIRVQYRLFNGRKSIRELIDAYQPSNEQQIKAGQKKKSWWRS